MRSSTALTGGPPPAAGRPGATVMLRGATSCPTGDRFGRPHARPLVHRTEAEQAAILGGNAVRVFRLVS